jgi:putative endonuclease
MLNRHQQFGHKSESVAIKLLISKGYRILAKNYRTKLGEIDIIAKERDAIVFIEVKARHSHRFGHPKFAVTAKKQKKISMTALSYLKATNQMNCKARFDVVAITAKDNEPYIEIVRNAFELAYR